jgi:hypothetical protein
VSNFVPTIHALHLLAGGIVFISRGQQEWSFGGSSTRSNRKGIRRQKRKQDEHSHRRWMYTVNTELMGWSRINRLSGIAMGIGHRVLNHSEPVTRGLIQCVVLSPMLRYFDNYPNLGYHSGYKYTVYLPASMSSSNKLAVKYIPLRRRYKLGRPSKNLSARSSSA